MSPSCAAAEIVPSFPRYFRIGRHWVSAYKIFFCMGIYTGTLVSAAVAQNSGIPPLRMGLGCVACAIVGLIGARLFHLLVFARLYTNGRWRTEVANPKSGGGSLFGGLLIAPFSFLLTAWLDMPAAVYWDALMCGMVASAVWMRLGCVCNGCCGGKRTTAWCGVRLPDIRGARARRIPVQWLEIGWWLLASAGLLWLWPKALPSGSYALGVLSWYGLGRFWLESLREAPDLVAGRVRINQVMAALLALVSSAALFFIG